MPVLRPFLAASAIAWEERPRRMTHECSSCLNATADDEKLASPTAVP